MSPKELEEWIDNHCASSDEFDRAEYEREQLDYLEWDWANNFEL